jgi:hypothetical protein
MADAATADLVAGALYSMSHRSALVTVQRCDACHATALSKSSSTPIAATLWRAGAYHASVATQPAACLDCHAASGPPPNASTQSTAVSALVMGAPPATGRSG